MFLFLLGVWAIIWEVICLCDPVETKPTKDDYQYIKCRSSSSTARTAFNGAHTSTAKFKSTAAANEALATVVECST